MVLKHGLFSNSLCKRPPALLDKLRARAFSYFQMEKMAEYRDCVRVEHQVATSCREKEEPQTSPQREKWIQGKEGLNFPRQSLVVAVVFNQRRTSNMRVKSVSDSWSVPSSNST
ncbi:hypothetical protein CR513_37478, partial [Mucuna pruriens]